MVAREFTALEGARHSERVRDIAKGFLASALQDGPVEVATLKAGAAT
jgi:hypothetical protein